MLDIIQYPQGEEKVSGSDDKATAIQTPAKGIASEPKN